MTENNSTDTPTRIIRVYTSYASDIGRSIARHDYRGAAWVHRDNPQRLTIVTENGDAIAEYPDHQWDRVEWVTQ
jgi:hypothetical protein